MDNYLLEAALDADNKPVSDRLFLLHLSRKVDKDLAEALQDIEGLDALEPRGKYTLLVNIAKLFSPDEVIGAIKSALDRCFSSILVPGDQFKQVKRNISEARR